MSCKCKRPIGWPPIGAIWLKDEGRYEYTQQYFDLREQAHIFDRLEAKEASRSNYSAGDAQDELQAREDFLLHIPGSLILWNHGKTSYFPKSKLTKLLLTARHVFTENQTRFPNLFCIYTKQIILTKKTPSGLNSFSDF